MAEENEIIIKLESLTKRYGYGDAASYALKDYDLTEKGGSLKMSYNIDSNLKLVSRNEVSIKIREI